MAAEFLQQRRRRLPVVVKFSNDTEPAQVGKLVGLLVELGYDGVNFGNTSTAYRELAVGDRPAGKAALRLLHRHFGGGVSGLPLRERSRELCRLALAAAAGAPHEFHVWRTGGIESAADLKESATLGYGFASGIPATSSSFRRTVTISTSGYIASFVSHRKSSRSSPCVLPASLPPVSWRSCR